MKIHIVGAGPSGMSLAWEILRSGNHDITIYDKKVGAGGSWWEPTIKKRDLHAHRIVFDRAFVNTQSLFREMDISWNSIFKPINDGDHLMFALRSLNLQDYGSLIPLFLKVYARPEKYKGLSLKEVIGPLSESGTRLLEHLPLIMDGVSWEKMSAYEFVMNLDHTGLSKPHTQRVSGKIMNDAMEKALLDMGVNFIYGVELENIEYGDDSYSATFSNNMTIEDGYLLLCVDNAPAYELIGDNWGPDAIEKVRDSTYGAICVLLDYDEEITLKTDLEISTKTKWNLQPKVLADGRTVACVICDITPELYQTNPETLKLGVLEQLELPQPREMRIGWGSEWDGEKWNFSQSSGVLNLKGPLPFFGQCSRVAMCGMMSPRYTPYSSIESAIEVSRTLSSELFGTRPPLKPILLSQVIAISITTLIVLILLYRNRKL